MKNFLAVMGLIYLLTWAVRCATAGTCTVTWDYEAPATSYEVFRGTELLATVNTNVATLTLPDDVVSTLHVIAISGTYRSGPSNLLHVMPCRPQLSLGLKEWDQLATVYATIPTPLPPPQAFLRVAFPTL